MNTTQLHLNLNDNAWNTLDADSDIIDTIPTNEFMSKLDILSSCFDPTISQTILSYSEQYVIPIYDQTNLAPMIETVPFQISIPGIEAMIYSRNIIRSLYQLRNVNHVCNINLANKNINDNHMIALGKLLRNNSIWISIKLMENCISCVGVRTLVTHALLFHNQHLKKLHLSRNFVGNQGAHILGHMLCQNQTLEVLNLSSNVISDKGCIHIGLGLRENYGLQELRLSFNLITDIGVSELAKSLTINRHLILLNLMTNNISNTGCYHIMQSIKQNDIIQFVSLAYNPINRHMKNTINQYTILRRKTTQNMTFKFIV